MRALRGRSIKAVYRAQSDIEQGFEPPATGAGAVSVPGFQRGFDARDFGVREAELRRWERQRGVPDGAILAGDDLAFQFDGFLLVGIERELVLYGPNRASRSNVCSLRALVHGHPPLSYATKYVIAVTDQLQ